MSVVGMSGFQNSVPFKRTQSELTLQSFDLGACLHERFEQQVERTPDAVALVWEDESLSYAQLNRRANWLAHHLRELSVTADQLVGLHIERGIEMVVGIIGILKAGAAYLPLDPVYPRDRVAFMLEDSGVQVVVTQESLIANLEGSLVARVLCGELLSGLDNNPAPVATANNLAYVIYTSGSTGRPKGALITHYNVTRLFDATESSYHFGEQDVWTLFHSYAFDFSVWELWGALLNGGRLVVVPYWISRSPEDFRELLVREGVTVLNQTPSAFRQLIQVELAQPNADLALRYVIFGGEALELQSLRPWFMRYGDERPQLVNMYGITETTVHVTYRPIRWSDLRFGQGSVIGVPIPDLQLYILEPDGEPTSVGVSGEIYVGGAGVARGYLNRAELTAERFIADPFSPVGGALLYRTGDLARRLENGDIEYLGRIDHQVKIRGFRVELGEIESVIATHPAIADVVVIAREDAPGDKRLVAYIVAANAPADLANQLRELLRVGLPEYMVPAHFVSLGALPLTENGKVDRNALPAPDRAAPDATYVAPRTPTEETLAGIWAEILGLERVGIHDNFFELGGHSLLVVNALEKMRKAELHASVRTIFLTPTIAELAGAVAGVSDDVEVPPNLIPADCQTITPDMLPLVQLSLEEIERVVAAIPGGVANIQDIYPLPPMQEGMLFHHRRASTGDPYLVTTIFGSNSRELLDRYIQALQLVIDRHDILRTAFLWEDLSEPVQVVCRRAPLIVEELRFDAANGDIVEQLEKRFDPRQYRLDVRLAPIIRIFIAHDAANARWVMLRIHHHLLEDHTTDELMSEEIHLCLQGQAHLLPPALPFRNFVAQTRLGIPAEEHRTFFRHMLADVDEPTLPFGLTDVQGNVSMIAESRSLVDSALASRLRETAHKHGASAASLFHLAWAKVLSQCSGRDDVVFGTVLIGRMHAGQSAERVLGPFINTLPLRLQLGDTNVTDGIRQTHTRMAQLLGHEHASLAVAQGCSAVAAGPLFSALLNFRHLQIRGQIPETSNHAMATAVSRMGLELLKFEERTNFPLELSVDDLGDGFMLEAQAQSPIDPRRICNYMHTALEQLVVALETSPTSTLRSLNVLPGAERQQLLVEWNDTTRNYGDQARLHRLIEKQAAQTPDSVALEFDGQELTYAELNRRANQLARLLRQKGAGPDDLVGVFAERSFEMVLALLAVLKAGGAYVPLDPSYPPERLAHMLEDAQASLVLTQPHLAHQLPAAANGVLLLDASWKAYGDEAGDDLEDIGTPESLAYVIFTSGSTGRPKGAMNEHRGICNRLLWMQEQYGLSADDRILQKTPFSFDVSVWEFFWPLLTGARLVIARPEGHRDSAYLVELIRHTGITTLHFVPSMLRMFLEQEGVEACSSLTRVICSGEALPHELQERFFARLPWAELHNLYGPTEAAVDVTYWACQRGDTRLTVPIGRPVANTQMYVLDTRMGPVPVGVAGELYIGGVQVGRGYMRRDDLTVERFVPDPFARELGARLYKTGDLARYLPDGAIEYLGRTDFQVKIRGQRIELGEIEAMLNQHAGVAQSIVMMREDHPGDQRLVAYVVPRQADLSATVLKEHLSVQLPSYMVPSALVLLDELPLTSSGKIDRKGLPAPEYSDLQQTAYVAPQTPTEETLVTIWTDVLNLARVGIHDNFFELGGHSLLAVTVIERMRRAGLQADVRGLFLTPTIAELASAVGAESNEVDVPANLIPPGCEAITPDMLTLVQLSAEEIARVTTAVPGGAANIQDIYPLATLQEGFLFHHLLTTEGDLYIMETQFAFDSRERLDRYLQALQWVVDRNDIMRTVFLWEGLQEPVQVVCRQAPLIVEELSLDPADGDIAEQLSVRNNLLNYRLDLSLPPMIRIFLAFDAANERWVFHQLTHHLMDDQASVNMQEEELQAYLQGRVDQLPAPRHYRDYVAQARLGVPLEEHEAFFRELLGDVTEPTAPFGFNDVLGNGSRIEEARSFVDSSLALRLREMGQRTGVSTASLFHLGWAKVMSQCSGQDDVVFGTVLLGRMQGGQGADRVLGPCINTLPIRLSLGDVSVEECVRQAQALLAKVLRHEHAPLGLVQRCSAVGINIPVFNSILNYRRPSRGVGRDKRSTYAALAQGANPNRDEQLTVEWFSEEIEGRQFIRFLERTNYPLTLSVDDFGDGFRLVAQVQAPIDPQRICSYMHTALEQIVGALESSPTAPIRSLGVMPDAERHELLEGWNNTQADYPRDHCIHQLFEAQVERTPDAVAVVFEREQLTYRELNRRANQLAHYLRKLGVGPEVLVGICLERSLEMVIGLLGILKAGGAYVPLDTNYPKERLSFILENAGVSILLTQRPLLTKLPAHKASGVCLDRDWASIAKESKADPSNEATSRNLAYIIYTSGSTGKPKGVAIEHRSTVAFLSWAKAVYTSRDLEGVLASTSICFDLSVFELFCPLTSGGRAILAKDALELPSLPNNVGVTLVNTVPSAITELLRTDNGIPRSVRTVNLAGEPLSEGVVRQLYQRETIQQVFDLYGPSEDTTYSTYALRKSAGPATIGRPITNSQIYLLDRDRQPVPLGVPGELHIGGDGLARGYLDRAELTSEKFTPDPFSNRPGARLYGTGDLARYLPDGNIVFLGRLDQQVKIRGFRIELGEIEAILGHHPQVVEAIVAARENGQGEKRLVAYVVPEQGQAVTLNELRSFLKQKLPDYMVPSTFVFLDVLPLTPNRKVDRKALPEPDDSRPELIDAYVAPSTPIEKALAEMWMQVLCVEKVGIHDNFFELGGHSLLAMQLISRVRNSFGIELSVRSLFDAPTVAGLEMVVVNSLIEQTEPEETTQVFH
jgi:amino acid adenylation domain-containing protein